MRKSRFQLRPDVLLLLTAFSVVVPAATTSTCSAQTTKPAGSALLDGQQLRKIMKHLEEAGRTREIPTKVTLPLGATKGDEVLTVRELAFKRAEFEHGFYKSLKKGDDHIILAFRSPEKKWTAFLTTSRMKLISAVSWNAGETPTPWQGNDADQAFDNELAYWATLAEIF